MAMSPELSMGVIEVIYNCNGQTYWVNGIIDANGEEISLEFHFQRKRGQSMTDILWDKVKEINPEYYLRLVDIFDPSQWKNGYLYEVLW